MWHSPSSSFIFLLIIKTTISDISQSGYIYPQPPIQFDEPSTPSNLYLPPIIQDELYPAISIPPTSYLPPVIYPPLGTPPPEDDAIIIPALPPSNSYLPPQVKVLNMSCAMNTFFRSTIRLGLDSRTNLNTAVIDDSTEKCMRLTNGNLQIDMEGVQMGRCGMRACGRNMCVTLRVPTVANLKLPEDNVVTLQCTPQDSIVSHVKHLRFASAANSRARSNEGRIAAGGLQRNFATRINLLRRAQGSGSFDEIVQPGSAVQLGEDLVLRAQVLDNDGWQYSRIGSVVLRSSNSQRALTLVDENGCRSPGLRSICPQQPRQVTPLTTLLNFRAFLFQGAGKGDDMQIAVRMLGCLHARDCNLRNCDEPTNARFKRSTNKNNSEVTNWESLEFRVTSSTTDDLNILSTNSKFIFLLTVIIVLILALIVLFIKRHISSS